MVKQELQRIIDYAEKAKNCKIADEFAFNYLIMQFFFYNGMAIEDCYADIEDAVVDGTNDGGIDFVFYDDENDKIILGQSKYKESLAPNDVVTELNKMSNTVANFMIGNTGAYNSRVKLQLQNSLDRLSEEDTGNVEYHIYTTASVDMTAINTKIENQHASYSTDMINIYQKKDIEERINETMIRTELVSYASVDIDRPKNYLSYETDRIEGIVVNLSSKSLIKLFNKYADKGLFDLNIRKYIANKSVDAGIEKTLNSERENFWFLNNGLIIACKDFDLDGNTVKLWGFSIVNGGQTTNRIGKYKGENSQEFYIPCKIVREKQDSGGDVFFSKIAEATNSQKPIQPRDLKSNSPEMRMLQGWLRKENIELEIKRGDKSKLKSPKYKIKNDEFGQYILSFVLQKPGTSRSGKKRIFDNNDLYNQIYRVNYNADESHREFVISSIDLIERTNTIIADLKKSSSLNALQKEILKNGTQIIFAMLGVAYRIANNDLKKEDIIQDPNCVKTGSQFIYRKVLNYSLNEMEDYLKRIIVDVVKLVTETYQKNSSNTALEITSVSNYFKTDKKYYELVLAGVADNFEYAAGEDFLQKSRIFKQ